MIAHLISLLLLSGWCSAVVNQAVSNDTEAAGSESVIRREAPPSSYIIPPGGLNSGLDGLSDSYGAPLSKDSYLPPHPHVGPKPVYGPPQAVGNRGPTTGNFGHSSFGATDDFSPPPPPSGKYGPPSNSYGPPPKPSSNYGPPKLSFGPPKSSYGPPSNHGSSISSGYGPPPSIKYGPPKSQYGPPKPPKSVYGPPPSSYGPPPKLSFGPPPKSSYGPPPKPKIQYGPPPKFSYGPPPKPKPQYGPPKPNYGPPPKPKPVYGPPKPNYGPPKLNFAPPKPIYGAPSDIGFGANVGLSISDSFSAPPSGSGSHGVSFGSSPSQSYGPPVSSNAPLNIKPVYGVPSSGQGGSQGQISSHGVASPPTPPEITYDGWQPIAGFNQEPSNNYGAPQTQSSGSSSAGNDGYDGSPPPLPNGNFGSPGSTYGPPSDTYGVPEQSGQGLDLTPPGGSHDGGFGDIGTVNTDVGGNIGLFGSHGSSIGGSGLDIKDSYGIPPPPSTVSYEISGNHGTSHSAGGGSGGEGSLSGSYGPPTSSVSIVLGHSSGGFGGGSYSSSPSSSYGPPPSGPINTPSGNYGPPSGSYAPPSGSFAPPSGSFAPPSGSYGPPSGNFGPASGNHGTSSSSFVPPTGSYGLPQTAPSGPGTAHGSSGNSFGGSFSGHSAGGSYSPPSPSFAPAPSNSYGPPSGEGNNDLEGGSFGVPLAGCCGTPPPDLQNSQQYLQLGLEYGVPSGKQVEGPNIQPKVPVKFRDPVPKGFIQALGESAEYKSSGQGRPYQGSTYIPPSVPEVPQEVDSSDEHHGVDQNGFTGAGHIQLNGGQGRHQPQGGFQGQYDVSAQQGAYQLSPSVDLSPPNEFTNYASQSEHHARLSTAQGANVDASDVNHKELVQSIGIENADITRSQSLDINNGLDIPVTGKHGSYTLQIQGGSPGNGVSHEQVLSNGLLQDILSAIEQEPTSVQGVQASYGSQDIAPSASEQHVVRVPDQRFSRQNAPNDETLTAEESTNPKISPDKIALYYNSEPRNSRNATEITVQNDVEGRDAQPVLEEKTEETQNADDQKVGTYVHFASPDSKYSYDITTSSTTKAHQR